MGGGAWVREASAESRVHSGDLVGTWNSSGEFSKRGHYTVNRNRKASECFIHFEEI